MASKDSITCTIMAGNCIHHVGNDKMLQDSLRLDDSASAGAVGMTPSDDNVQTCDEPTLVLVRT